MKRRTKKNTINLDLPIDNYGKSCYNVIVIKKEVQRKTVKELAEVIPDGVDLCLHFNGEDIIYNTPLAEVVGNCIIEKIELDTVNTPPRTIYANIKYIIARKEG